MKAYRLFSPAPIESNPLERVELPIPAPGLGQVRIKVSVCGVCHTDLHTTEGEIHPPRLPVTLGHQVVGAVDAVGKLKRKSKLLAAGQTLRGLPGVLVGEGDKRTAFGTVKLNRHLVL